ncbi:MAG: STAS domain-containing protein [Bacteroidota bacterium]
MQIHVTDHGGVAVVALEGDAMGGPDGSVLHERLRQLRTDGQKQFVVDLNGVERMNSSGLGMLIGALTIVRNAGGNLVLANVHERVHQLLTVTQLLSVFSIFEDVPVAAASFGE